MLNVVAKEDGVDYGAAVLIRAFEPLDGVSQMTALRNVNTVDRVGRGPGCLTEALAISGIMNGLDICSEDSPVYIESLGLNQGEEVISGPRVGIAYASEAWREMPWRFMIAGSKWISGKR